MRKYPWLVLVLVLATCLRFYRLTDTPPALNWDEVSHGYNAYSLLKTGRDEWGQFLPLANFRAYGDYPLPANLYLTIPSVLIFGLNEFGIRAPHALLGVLTVLSSFFLARALGFKFWTSLTAASLVALDPWTFFPSRFVIQSNLSVFFVVTGLALFFNRKKKSFFLPLAALMLGVSTYSYHNTRIVTPLLVAFLAFVYRSEWRQWWQKKKISLIATVLLLLVFFLPLVVILLGPESRARARWVSIVDEGAVNQIIANRLNSDLPEILARLLYNRPVYFLTHFFSNYFGYFSPHFLFLAGGTQFQFSVPGRGVLYPVEMPFFYLGLLLCAFWALVKKKKLPLVIFIWLLFAPIPAALTRGENHVIRASTLLPLPQVLTALGVFQAGRFLNQKIRGAKFILIAVFLLLIFISAANYLGTYFGLYRQNYSWSWQYGYREVASLVKAYYKDYDRILITKKYGEPHEFLLFYLKWEPEKYRTDPNLNRYFQTDWYWVDSFDKFVFINDWEVKEKLKVKTPRQETDRQKSKVLLITSPDNYPEGWEKLEEIYFLDGQLAFEILAGG